MEKIVALKNIELSDDGYMVNFSQWNQEIGIEFAKVEDIEMTDSHWEVVNYLQDQHLMDKPLSIRGIKKSGVVNIKEFYKLFPAGPLKVSTRIAGIPKPKSCI